MSNKKNKKGLEKEKYIDKISYKTFLNSYNTSDTSAKEESIKINKELYINIDPKNNFIKTTEKDSMLVNQRIETFKDNKNKDNSEEEIKKESLTKEIMRNFLDKLYPKCDIKARKISYLISREIKTIKKLNRDTIEEYLNYFFYKRFDLKYSTSLKFTREFFTNCGYIFCYIFSKINENHIKQIGGIKQYINKVINNNISVIIDFYNYCTEKEQDPSEMKKGTVFHSLKKKYELPPEFIFLVNMFQGIDTLEFEIEFEGEILNEIDINLFTITILNISYILPKLEHVNINFINNKLQFYLYNKYYTKIFNILKIAKENIKKNKINDILSIYNKKWDFEHEFNLEEYRKNQIEKDKKEKENFINNIIYDKYSILYTYDYKNNNNLKNDKRSSICNSAILKNLTSKILNSGTNEYEVISEEEEEIDEFFNKIKSSRSETIYIKSNKLNELKKENSKGNLNKPENIKSTDINQNYIIYNIILMIICGVTRIESIKKLNILSNDFYNNDLILYLKNYFGIDVISIDAEFHVLDLLYNKTKNLDLLNIEINSLDILSFDKILGIIYKNQSLRSLKLSLFSSDVSYLIITLFKAYEELKSYEEIKKYVINEGNRFTEEKFETKIINDIALCFIENLSLLFEIIKTKKNLEVLGLNFDIPSILINNMNYKLPIIKFILNILFLIDNNEIDKKSKITKLTILSPYTILDNRLENNINDIFKDITIYKNSKTLRELNIQTIFYNIIYIKNIISPNLVKLSIGDLDIITLNQLVNYLTSYEFSSKSSLNNLSIKILRNITYFGTKIKLILRKLFSIKIKSLLELNIFSNIIISDKFNYLYLIKSLRYNWIPSYVITLNKKSKDTLAKYFFIKNDISFLVTCSIENYIFQDVPINTIKKDKNDQKNDINDEVVWMLKYIFYCRYSKYSLTFLEVKNIIFSILKYLYLTSNVKLNLVNSY